MWEQFTKHSKDLLRIIASLNGTAKVPRLSIGKVLTNAGFDVAARYDVYFDADTRRLGLKMSDTGFRLMTGTGGTYFTFTSVCRYYKLNKRYTVASFEREGDMWVLPLTEIEEKAD
jgi:hypothetical protein